MPGLAFLHALSSRVAQATACCVIVVILARSTASALGDGQPYLVKDINFLQSTTTTGNQARSPDATRPIKDAGRRNANVS